jgi:hypothetical protein
VIIGFIRRKAKAKCQPCTWNETCASSQITDLVTLGQQNFPLWRLGTHVIAQSGDQCVPGSWIFVRDAEVRV